MSKEELVTYIFRAPHDGLEEVDVRAVERWHVRLAVLDQERVELLLALHLA